MPIALYLCLLYNENYDCQISSFLPLWSEFEATFSCHTNILIFFVGMSPYGKTKIFNFLIVQIQKCFEDICDIPFIRDGQLHLLC